MSNLLLFKATRESRRFRANQKVWIVHIHDSYYEIVFRWRGRGRMVSGRVAKVHRTSVRLKRLK